MRGFEAAGPASEAQRFGGGLTGFRGGQAAVIVHAGKDPFLAFFGAFEIPVGVEPGGGLRQTGEEGAFGQAEVFERFFKVQGGGGGAAGSLIAVFHALEVSGEDAFLVPCDFHFSREGHFAQFILPGAVVVAFAGYLDQLLGDGGGAGDRAAGKK